MSEFDQKKIPEKLNVSDEIQTDLSDDIEDREYLIEFADEQNPRGLILAQPHDRKKYKIITTRPDLVCYLMLAVEFAERGSYYGIQQIMTNFALRPLPDGSTTGAVVDGDANASAGALGLGTSVANALTMLLQFLAYLMPLLGGWVSDARIGKFKTIMIGVWIGLLSHVIFVISAIPKVIAGGHALVAFIFGIITLSFGTGFIKPNLLPLLLDQYPYPSDVLRREPDGSIVFIDRERSMETITMTFYWCINTGAFLGLATSYAARDVGYWLAFLCPGIMYLLVCILMIFVGPRIKKEAPQGSILGKVCKVLGVCLSGNFIKRIKHNEFWAYAYPEKMAVRGARNPSWTLQDVRDYAVTFSSCAMFVYWIFFNLNDSGLGTSLNAQAGAMTTKNVPNDLFNNFNQITIIVLLPILDRVIYPALIRSHINFKGVYKIFVGFMLGALSSMVGAILQWRVYSTSPCGYYATDCDDVSPITAWYEVIVYALAAAGECFCYTQAYEIAYTRAPDGSKSLVMALFLLMNAFSAAISEACSAALVDPYLIWPFVAVTVAGAVFAGIFLIKYWNLDLTMAREAEERAQAKDELRIAATRSGASIEVESIASEVVSHR